MSKDLNLCKTLANMPVTIPSGVDLLRHIVSLQRAFGSKFCDFDKLDEAGRIEKTMYYLACLTNELEEIRDWLPWKQHKKYVGHVIETEEIQFEIIDVLCYLLNLAAVWGMDTDKLVERYIQKNYENIQRQERQNENSSEQSS